MPDLFGRDLLRATAVGAGMAVIPSIIAGGTPALADQGPTSSYDLGSPPAGLTGRVVRPMAPDYADASLGWDELFVRYPLVIVFAQDTQDVVNALAWARQHDVALRVRSGRHSLEGWSNVDNGIVIDVSELKSIHVDTAARAATVGAGLDQLEAVTWLAEQDLAVTTGTEGSVGLSGATLGGGFGFLTRYFGMTCDNLIGAVIPLLLLDRVMTLAQDDTGTTVFFSFDAVITAGFALLAWSWTRGTGRVRAGAVWLGTTVVLLVLIGSRLYIGWGRLSEAITSLIIGSLWAAATIVVIRVRATSHQDPAVPATQVPSRP